MTNTISFYDDLPTFNEFSGACDLDNYTPAPHDWHVVITDIQGSTKAIEEGRYKDVNMVGAASIAAAVNVCEDINVPYVFGGDGATLLVPPKYLDDVIDALMALRTKVKKCHQLILRVGSVPVEEIIKRGKRFDVAKFEMKTGATLAMFSGGGTALADDILKNEDLFIKSKNKVKANLEGLSCRWHPIKSKHDHILTLLVKVTNPDKEQELYAQVNNTINDVLNNNLNPVNIELMKYKWPTWETLRQSQMVWRKGTRLWRLFTHTATITIFNIMNRFNIDLGDFKMDAYRDDMRDSSDFQKFDDVLRMVVDCTTEQFTQIEGHLKKLEEEEEIVFGTHLSSTALMTCFVETLTPGGHVHFIDGNDGGYAMAAADMKLKLNPPMNENTATAKPSVEGASVNS